MSPLFLHSESDKTPSQRRTAPADLSSPEAVSRFADVDERLAARLASVNQKQKPAGDTAGFLSTV